MGTSYPHAVLEKLVEECGVEFLRLAHLPDGHIRSVKSEFTDPKPLVLRADHVFYVGASSPYTVAAEIQRHIDDEKPAAWTGYMAFLFRKYQCPAEIVVLTNSRDVEKWARKPIEVSRKFSWTPTVLGPSNIPSQISREDLKGRPFLGLLYSMVHSNQEYAEELYQHTLDEGVTSWKQGELKESEFKDFLDTMLTAVTAAWRREIMESNMQTRTFLEELEARAIEKGIEEGIEKGIEKGIGRGKEDGLRESIQVVCKKRGLILNSAHIENLQACHDHDTLMRWLELAMSAASSEDVFA